MKSTRLLSVLAMAALGGGAAAQDQSELTVEQLRFLLNQQTRGLVIAPSGDDPAATDSSNATQVVEQGYKPVDESVRIDIPIVFDFDSAAIRDDQRAKLDTLCQAVKTSNVQRLQIIGHTDATGSAAYNATLSQLRADEVKRHLVNNCGIEEFRLEAIGVGEDFPANEADPEAPENRRVEFQALS